MKTTKLPNIVWWQPVLTDHQAHTIAATQIAAGVRIKAVVVDLEDPIRQSQGWTMVNTNIFEIVQIPKSGWYKWIFGFVKDNSTSIHFFGSPFGDYKIMIGIIFAIISKIKICLVSEPYASVSEGYFSRVITTADKWRRRLRPTIYKFYGAILKNFVLGVFAISVRAVHQYRKIGFSDDQIFPFGYFVPSIHPIPATDKVNNSLPIQSNIFRVIFIGSLIPIKGIGDLIEAAMILADQNACIQIDCYGPGDQNDYKFDDRIIHYCGVIPFGQSQLVLTDYDLLVLPSRYDGWGVVVNEALLTGIPVACSDMVGANILLTTGNCGYIFKSADPVDLAFTLKSISENRQECSLMRQRAGKMKTLLEPEVAGSYVNEALCFLLNNDKKPKSPWYYGPYNI